MRDLSATKNLEYTNSLQEEKLYKLALLFSLIEHYDSAANLINSFTANFKPPFLKHALDLLFSATPMARYFGSYNEYINAFNNNDPFFYDAYKKRLGEVAESREEINNDIANDIASKSYIEKLKHYIFNKVIR